MEQIVLKPSDSDCECRPGRGRPRCPVKNSAILNAASDLFMDKGFDNTSMDEVARRAGVSKQTVYSHFSSKEQLFSASVHAKIQEHSPETALEKFGTGALESDLLVVCETFLRLLVSEDAIAMVRLLAGAASKGPALAQIFWDSGPQEMLKSIETFLKSWVEKGALAIDDTEAAALQLISLLKGQHHFQMSIGLIDGVSEEAIQLHVRQSVDSFLKLYKA